MAVAYALNPEFDNVAASKTRGFYRGIPLQQVADVQELVDYFEAPGQEASRVDVEMLAEAGDGSKKISITFLNKNEKENLAMEVAFIKAPGNPRDWAGYDHHIIMSVGQGCPNGCDMCVDGDKKSFKGHFSPEQMAYAVHKIIQVAGDEVGTQARLKIMQLGSDDPFANAQNVAPFLEHVHRIDPRIRYVYTSTAGNYGTSGKPTQFFDAMAKAAQKAKGQDVIVGSQFSVHTMDPEKRLLLIPHPKTTSIEQCVAAEIWAKETGNDAFINYMVVPGWNDTEEDAGQLARNIAPNSTLKLVALNPVVPINGKPVSEFLNQTCSQEQVKAFETLIQKKLAEYGRNFPIIAPVDKGDVVRAQCGTVGETHTAGTQAYGAAAASQGNSIANLYPELIG